VVRPQSLVQSCASAFFRGAFFFTGYFFFTSFFLGASL